MSKRTEELADQVISLQGELDDARREVAEVSGANGRIAARLAEAESALARTHRDRDAAYKRITALEGQAERQDVVLIRFLNEHLTGTSTAGMVLARDLRDRLAGAGCAPVGSEVGLPVQVEVSP